MTLSRFLLLALSAVSLESRAADNSGSFPEFSKEQMAAGSLSSLLLSGKARFSTAEKKEGKRLAKILAERERVRFLEAQLSSLEASLVSRFDDKQGDLIRSYTVTLLNSSDVQVGQGVLIESQVGWVIAPLDIARKHRKELVLVLGDGSHHRGKHLVLSEKDNLALFEIEGSQLAGSSSEKSLSVAESTEVGALIAASGEYRKLVVGGVSAIEASFQRWHSAPVRDQIDSHLASFSIAVDKSLQQSGRIILCDLDIQQEFRGTPVFSLQGDFVGVAMSRVDLSETVILPADLLRERMRQSGRNFDFE